jgi:hypothetical protein
LFFFFFFFKRRRPTRHKRPQLSSILLMTAVDPSPSIAGRLSRHKNYKIYKNQGDTAAAPPTVQGPFFFLRKNC